MGLLGKWDCLVCGRSKAPWMAPCGCEKRKDLFCYRCRELFSECPCDYPKLFSLDNKDEIKNIDLVCSRCKESFLECLCGKATLVRKDEIECMDCFEITGQETCQRIM